jgi:hypothetical protein
MVNATTIAMSTAPPPANIRVTSVSTLVSRLKCEGTPRQACNVTSTVSSTHATVNKPRNGADAVTEPQERHDPCNGYQRHAERQPERGRLGSDSGPVHDAPADNQDRQMNDAADDQQRAHKIADALTAPAVTPDRLIARVAGRSDNVRLVIIG